MRTVLRAAAAAGTVAAVVAGAGVAYAAWTGTASGTAAARSGTVSFTLRATSTSGGSAIQNLLRPGSVAGTATGGDLTVTIANTSGFAVRVVSVALNGTVTSDKPACVAHGVTVGTAGTYAVPAATLTVPGDGQDHDVVVPNALGMATTSDSGCQGATFTVPVTVTVST